MKLRTTIIIFFTAFLTLPVFAEKVSMPPLSMSTAASNGFGGHHVAYTDNVFSLLVNPAAMIRTQQRSFFTLAPSIMSPQTTFDLLNPIIDYAKGDNGALNGANIPGGRASLGAELREFPFSFAWVANGFGFALWNRVFVNANILPGLHVEADVYSDLMLPVGFAFKIFNSENHSVDTGLTVKPFARAMAYTRQPLINGADALVDELNIPVIIGGGLDLGLLYRWSAGLQAGLTFTDVYSRGEVIYNSNKDREDTNSYYFPFAMNFGLSYHIDLAFLGITVAADWRDVTNLFHQDGDDFLDHRNYVLDFGAGLELSLFKMIFLRAGMSEMLPSAGIGFSFGPCKIDLAYYGREFGMEPGDLSVATAEVSISFRPGAKKRNWAWTRRSLVGLFTGVETVDEAAADESPAAVE